MPGFSESVVQQLTGGAAWNLAAAGRLLLRVRPTDPTGTDQWFVIVPEVPNTVTVAGVAATVTVSIAVAAGVQVGLSAVVAAPGVTGHSFTVFVNVSTNAASPIFAYVGVPASATGLPQSTTIKVTTPATALPTLDQLELAVSTTGPVNGIAVDGGIVSGTTIQGSARVVVGPADVLAAHLRVTTVLGLPSTLNTLSGQQSLMVALPAQDADAAALADPLVRSCAGATMLLTLPVTAPFLLPAGNPLRVTLAFESATSRFGWHAPQSLLTTLALVLKDSVASEGTTNHATMLSAQGVFPVDASLVTTESPQTYRWQGAAVMPSLELMISSSALTVPALDPVRRTTRVHLDDMPRAVFVDLGTHDPALKTRAEASVAFSDETGHAAAVTRVALSTIAASTGISLPPETPAELGVSYDDGAVRAQAFGLQQAGFRFTIAPLATGGENILAAANVVLRDLLPASITINTDDVAVAVSTPAFPAEFAADASARTTPAQGSTPEALLARLTWKLSAAMGTTFAFTEGAPGDAAYQNLRVDAAALPARFRGVLGLANNAVRVKTSADADFGAVAGTYYFGADEAKATAALSSVPSALDTTVDFHTTRAYLFKYGAVAPVERIAVTFTSPNLREPDPTAIFGVPALDHLSGHVFGLPATSTVPANPAASAIVGGLATPPPGEAGLIAILVAPAAVPPIGLVSVELTDQPTTTTPLVADGLVFSQTVRRKRDFYGDQLEAIGAPTGRRTYAAVPGLRAVFLNTRSPMLGSTSTKPLWLLLRLDQALPAKVEIALDSHPPADPEASSLWLNATASPTAAVQVNGSLEEPLTSLGFELAPQPVSIDAVLHSYDGAAHPEVDASGDATAKAQAHHRRVDLRAIPADRVLLELGEVENPSTVGNSITRPPADSYPRWNGLRLESSARRYLPPPAAPTTVTNVWARVAQNHDADDPAWSSWLGFPDTRAHVRLLDTVTIKVGAPPPPKERDKFVETGNPNGYVETHLTSRELFAHVAEIATAEISTGTGLAFPTAGTGPPTFVGLVTTNTPDATIVVDDLAAHTGTSSNQIVARLSNLPTELAVMVTPEALFRVNAAKRQELTLHMIRKELTADISGRWVHGFPLLTPPAGAVLDDHEKPRPTGLTGIQLTATLPSVRFSRHRTWTPATGGAPLAETLADTFNLAGSGAIRAVGWAIFDRPSGEQMVETLNTALSAMGGGQFSQAVTLVQSTLPVPTYNPPANLPAPGLPGRSPDACGVAVDANVRQVCVSATSSGDADERPLPVFLADDTITGQVGRQGQLVSLRAPFSALPIAVKAIEVEFGTWPDTEPQPSPQQLLSVLLRAPPERLTYSNDAEVRPPQSDGRAARTNRLVLSSGEIGAAGVGGVDDTSGPPFGEIEVDLDSPNFTSCRWAPTIDLVDAKLTTVPGWLRVRSATNENPARFPRTSNPTRLSMGSFNQPIPYTGDKLHPDQRPWQTRLLTIAASGSLAGTIDLQSASQQWNNSGPIPTEPPDEITWGRTLITGLNLEIAAGGNPLNDPPNLAILSGISGPPNKDDELKGLGFRVPPGSTLSAVIKASGTYDKVYAGVLQRGSEIDGINSNLSKITFTGFSGELSVQPPPPPVDTKLIKMAIIAGIAAETAGSIFGGFIGTIIGGAVGAGLITAAVSETLSDNDPIVHDPSGVGWRIDPDKSKIPQPIKAMFRFFGPDGRPGHWHMTTAWEAWVAAAAAAALIGGTTLIGLLPAAIAIIIVSAIGIVIILV